MCVRGRGLGFAARHACVRRVQGTADGKKLLQAAVQVAVNTDVVPQAVVMAVEERVAAVKALADARLEVGVDNGVADAVLNSARHDAARALIDARARLACGRPYVGARDTPAHHTTSIAGAAVCADVTAARALACFLGPLATAWVIAAPPPTARNADGPDWLAATPAVAAAPLPGGDGWKPEAAGFARAVDAVEAPAGPVAAAVAAVLCRLALAPDDDAARGAHAAAAAAGWSLLVSGSRTLYDARGFVAALHDAGGCLGSKCVAAQRRRGGGGATDANCQWGCTTGGEPARACGSEAARGRG